MTQDIITKAISFVSPKAALDRMVNQAKLRNFGRFDSALTSEKRGISRGVSGGEDTAGTREPSRSSAPLAISQTIFRLSVLCF